MKPAILEDNDWHEDALATIEQLARDLPEFTAEDLRKEMRMPPVANWIGLAFTAAKREGLIEAVSHAISHNKSRKHGSLRTWRRKTEGAS